ncbi:OpgC family protein [Pseudooctadecabacter jejudonensis]|uniref:OpgC protein n=1 Tax=Pseudooctadecabacter jejudonensis TaxID=1391910 RepID=A0A1Y5SMB9_9RHOB|nr:OpgC domain-containing protein [Pseudooctadecabacter jejudonensis]SLN44070.1 OpgC protein [Pseudooctadecabacter jejudonensis]
MSDTTLHPNAADKAAPDAIAPSAAAPTSGGPRVRDVRLDFFRGVAMFIILFAHTPGNWITLWIPARWGFSDATEMFVFCSGMASAIAFGATFDRAGILLGTARVVFRIWQVYWAHIGTFFATAALMVYFTDLEATSRNYWGNLNLWMLFVESDMWENPNILLSVMTLQWVPNLFDILPMYMVILAMMPVIVLLSRVHLGLVALFVVTVWIFAQRALSDAYGIPYFNFTAEPWVGDDNWQRRWFLNPFGWQLAFFTGFAFMRGWLPKPPVNVWLIGFSAAIVIANIPFSNIGVREFGFDFARAWRSENAAWFSKSDFGLLRFVQFLALAYLGWVIAGDKGNRIRAGASALGRMWAPILAIILKVGQQSLAVFVVSILVGRTNGVILDLVGRDYWSMTWVNALGMALLVITAYGAAWMKSQPWRVRAQKHAAA